MEELVELITDALNPDSGEVTVFSLILYNLMRIADAAERISPPPAEGEVMQ